MKLYITLEDGNQKVERVLTTTTNEFPADMNEVVNDMINTLEKQL